MTRPDRHRQARKTTDVKCRALAFGRAVCAATGVALVAALVIGTAEAAARLSPAEIEAKAHDGDAVAQFELARSYDAAAPGIRTQARAFELYCQAASQGHAAAAFGVGRMYFSGLGVARNTDQAAAWFRLAAERGHALAARLVQHFDGTRRVAPSGCGPLATRSARSASPAIAAPAEIADLVATLAPDYGLDPDLVLAIIAVESAFRRDAVSSRHAGGLMQLMPETAARFGVARISDPEENIRGGMSYLRWLTDYFEGNLVLVLAAYNAGEGAVERFGGVPPFAETRAYLEKIRGLYNPPGVLIAATDRW